MNIAQPKSLPRIYVWEKQDDFLRICIKLTGSADEWYHILDNNRNMVADRNYLMKAGDVIQLPEVLYPKMTYLDRGLYEEVEVVSEVDQEHFILLKKVARDELDALLHGHKYLPRGYVRASKTEPA